MTLPAERNAVVSEHGAVSSPAAAPLLRPMNDRVLVRRIKEPPVSSAIIAPDCVQLADTLGEVVAVGPGKRLKDGARLPLDVKPGDLVRFGALNDWADGEYLLIQEADIRFKLPAMPKTGNFPEVPNYYGQ